MAEVIGLVASLIAVAGVGAKLAEALFKIGARTIEADHQVNRVAMNITLFSGTLKHFAMVADQNRELLSAEGQEIAGLLMEQCDGVFADFTKMVVGINKSFGDEATLKKSRPTRAKIVDKIKTFFQVPQVNTLLAELEYLKSTLSLLVGTLTLAVTTASARRETIQAQTRTLSTETNQRLQNERIHVETLIISRQLTMNILIAKGADEVNPDTEGHISPAASEDSFEDLGQKHKALLLPPPPTSMSIMRLGDPKNEYIHRAFPTVPAPALNDEEELRPIMSASHNQIIDQLLGRWTTLDRFESEMQSPTVEKAEPKPDAKDEMPRTRADSAIVSPVAISTPELTLSRVESPADITPVVSAGQTGSTASSVTNEPISTRRGTSLTTTVPLPPPPRNTRNLKLNDKLTPGPSPHLNRSMSTPGVERTQMPIRAPSPQPNNANAMMIPNQNYHMVRSTRYDRYGGLSPNVSPTGSWQAPSQMQSRRRPKGNYKRPTVADSASEDGSSESLDEEARLGYGVEWTIRCGQRYWDVLDGRIIGPRTPMLPTETLEELYAKANVRTDIAQAWISMEALNEGKWQYRFEKIDNEYMPSSTGEQRRIVFDRAMQTADIQHLVQRSGELYEMRMKRARDNNNQQQHRQQPPPRPTQRRSSMRGANGPPPIVTHGHQQQPPWHPGTGPAPSPQTPRDREAPGQVFAQMNSRRLPYPKGPPYPPARHSSYQDGPISSSRPGTAGSTGSRMSTDMSALNDRSVHFTESVAGGDGPARGGRDFAPQQSRDPYEQNNFYYTRRAETRERDRENQRRRDHERGREREWEHSDISGDERRRDRKHRGASSRAVKLGASMAGMAGLLETLDVLF